MSLPQIGKIDRRVFDEVIFPRLGARRREVILGPTHGVDAAAVELAEDLVMVVAEDPTFGMPSIMPYFGWAIVHICASDVAVLGVAPRYMTISLLLPPGSDEELLRRAWSQVHEESEKLGIAIIGGHTGVYPGIAYPLNGGCTAIGIGRRSDLRPSSNARAGDALVITKGAAIEAAAILALQAEEELAAALGRATVEEAKSLVTRMTVVEDALIAAGRAHAMHDATEGGLLNGVYEMAEASGLGVVVEEERIPIPPAARAVCDYFGIDPLTSISEGTLIAAVPQEEVDALLRDLRARGIEAAAIGRFTSDLRRVIARGDGREEPLGPVREDPFWRAYFKSLGEGR